MVFSLENVFVRVVDFSRRKEDNWTKNVTNSFLLISPKSPKKKPARKCDFSELKCGIHFYPCAYGAKCDANNLEAIVLIDENIY